MENTVKKGQKYQDVRMPFVKLTILKVLSNGMLLVHKNVKHHLRYDTKIHVDNLRNAYKLI